MPGFAPFCNLFQTMTFLSKRIKKEQRNEKKKTNCHRKTNIKNIEHNALYTPNKERRLSV